MSRRARGGHTTDPSIFQHRRTLDRLTQFSLLCNDPPRSPMQRVFPRVAPMRRTFASASSSSSYSFPRHKNATYWEILGVPEGASVQDVKVACTYDSTLEAQAWLTIVRADYKLVKTLHPDAHTQEDGHPIKIKVSNLRLSSS